MDCGAIFIIQLYLHAAFRIIENVNDTDDKNVACPAQPCYFYYNFLVYFIDLRYYFGDNTYLYNIIVTKDEKNVKRMILCKFLTD